MTPQEAARNKKELARKKQLDESKRPALITQQSVSDIRQKEKDLEKMRKERVQLLYHGGSKPNKRKPEAVTPPGPQSKKKNKPVQPKTKTTKVKRVEIDPQGQRKIPVPGDTHGCRHSGLLEMIMLDRSYLKSYVKEGGWLYQAPCKDCAKNKEGGTKRVLDVSSLLQVKGKGGLGAYCNCGPVAHKMVQADEPVRKQQWACDMILCMECYSKRKLGMGDTTTKRARRQTR
jgi:hypothetical protein